MTIKKHLWILLISAIPLFADKVITPRHQTDVPNPWFTGPLIAPTYAVIPLGHINYEPYLDVTATTGSYNQHWNVVKAPTLYSTTLQPFVQIGLGYKMDFQIAPTVSYNYCHHAASWAFGDFPLILDIQLLEPRPKADWRPYVKLILTEIFPTGKYRRLNPHKNGTDSGGKGSYVTEIGIVTGKMFRPTKHFFINTRFLVQYAFPSAVQLKGFNAYGGGYGTNAHFFPGQSLDLDFGLELTMTKNWVLACDFIGLWEKKDHFSGNPGKNADGTVASLGSKASIQYSIAPAVEYNWSDNLGVIGGVWFTLTGRNASRFWSAQLAINYYQ
jgi:hypothetical protein